MKKKFLVALVAIAVVGFCAPASAQARGGHGGPNLIVPCVFAGLGFLFGAAAAQPQPQPIVVARCFEKVPVLGNPRWDGHTYVRDIVGERLVPVRCPEGGRQR